MQSQYISPMGSRWPSARTSVAISRQQSYSAATTERAADDESATIAMNGDHIYFQVGNGEWFSSSPLRPRSDKGKNMVHTKSLCGQLKRGNADYCMYLMM